jgi:protein TorT
MMEYARRKASQKWKICVSFPHMKDDYWLAVDYGATTKTCAWASMQVLEAGYTELNKQLSQIENCVAAGARRSSSARSRSMANNLVELADKKIPDRRDQRHVRTSAAKSRNPFGEMGGKAGEYLVSCIRRAASL